MAKEKADKNNLASAPFAVLAEEPAAPSFSEAIYKAITKTFASSNPKQLFCLTWPGTILDYNRLKWDREDEVAGLMPERALVRTSQILDLYVPPSPITQPDGTRVSDRYEIALSSLGPKPNAGLLELQRIIRDRLRSEIKKTIDGKEQSYTLVSWFNYLYTQWTQVKEEWAIKQTEVQEKLRAQYKDDSEKMWDAYLVWYEENADSFIQEINSKWDQLLIEFPLTEWNDALAILDTKDDGGLNVAKDLIQNVRLPLPRQEGGVDYVPTTGVPYDWPLHLDPLTKHIDLLADPVAQKMVLDNAIQKLQDEVLNWMAILPQVKDEDVIEHTKAFDAAVRTYSTAQSNLLKTYSANAVRAVRVFCDIQKSRGLKLTDLVDTDKEKAETGIQNLITALDKASSTASTGVNWDQIIEIAGVIAEGHDNLIDKQEALIQSGMDLANAANEYLKDLANRTLLPWLPTYVEQLKSKLDDLKAQEQKLATSSNVYYKYLNATEEAAQADPSETGDFAKNALPSTIEIPGNDRWAEVTIVLDQSQMSSNSTMNTYFENHQWGVDFFLGSAGGTTQRNYSNFANSFMKAGSKIEIGFLATKVLIQRPWMKPEVFRNTESFFRTLEKPLSPKVQVTQDQLLDTKNPGFVSKLIHDYVFPAYPTAMLLVKDVTIKVQVDASKTESVRSLAKSIKSQGGGFLCFSISNVETSQSQSETMNSFCMAGQLIAKAPAPQILGYWVDFLPSDNSTKLDQTTATQIAEAIGFVNKLQEIHHATKERKETLLRL